MKVWGGKGVLRSGAMVVGLVVLVHGCQTLVTPMTEGEQLYRAKCSACHQPVDPGTRDANQWQAVLEHHGPRLTERERSTILTHLTQK
jgi:mono/diheme cytochrome c family protein